MTLPRRLFPFNPPAIMKVQHTAILALVPALSAFASCHIHIDDSSGSWTVDGVHLDEKHVDTIQILEWDPEGLDIDVAVGDVSVVSTDGPTEIVATLHEVEQGDAQLEYRDGKLTWESKTKDTAAISDVTVRVNGMLPALTISTSAGDVDIRDVILSAALLISTGAGDIRVQASGDLTSADFSTSAGDIRLSGFKSPKVTVSSDVGDLSLTDISTGMTDLSTDVGDIRARGCDLGILEASTGIGDIDVSEASYKDADLSTSIGDIDRADG